MIFAKIDVELRDHEKAHAAGTAMGTWTWALLWSRAKLRDGFVASEALRGAWAGEKQARADLARLVTVGLAEVAPGGWMLLGYAEKNETRVDVERRQEEGRARKARYDAKRNASRARVTDAEVTRYERGTNTTEPEPEPEPDLRSVDPPARTHASARVEASPETPAEPSDAPPAWWPGAAATVEQTTGRPVTDLGALWLEYRERCDRKHATPSQRDAVGWLAAVARSDARKAREAPARKPSQIVQSAENRGYVLNPEMP